MGRDLERQVFGGSDSELSSDEDEDLQQQQKQSLPSKPPRPPKPSRDEYESSGADSEDEYVQERQAVPKPKKRSRKSSGAAEDGEPKAQRKRKRKQPVEVDLTDLPPEQANRMRMEMKIDDIIRGGKKTNRPRKKKNNDEVLDSVADDEVARLRETMNNAAEEDIRSNMDKLPATSKLRLLPEAMETLRKASLAQSMIDNNLLEAVRRWLEPLPDRSLPALSIQREFFNLIKKMEFIDSAVLKESGLGRIVLFYTKCRRVTPEVTRTANDLVSLWSRPIIKRSASYRDRIVPISQQDDGGLGERAGERLNAILARAREAEKGRVKRNAVMIPQRELGTYTVAPRLNAGGRGNVSVDVDIERRRKNAERLRSLTRKVNVK